jgi:HD-GYP domain-containing protein (c-di-GMP phosphodiesterase class II)
MLPIILQQLMELLKVDGASLSMIDSVANDIVIQLGIGNGAAITGRRLQRGAGVTGQVIETGQLYHTNHASEDPRFLWPDVMTGVQAVVCAPLSAQGQVIGALWVGRATPISTAELRLITTIANIAANAIHRATLHEQTERRLERLTALHSIDLAITNSSDLSATLSIFLEHVVARLGVDAADILLLRAETQSLEFRVGRGFRSPAIENSYIQLGEGFAGQAAFEQRLVGSGQVDASAATGRAAVLAAEGFVAYYSAPLIVKNVVRGAIEIFHRQPLWPDPEWLEFFETLGGQAAIAVDNARLFEDLGRKNVELMMAYDATIEGWSRVLDLRDRETQGHTQRVTEMTIKLAWLMGIRDAQLAHIYRGALLHDIGKMAIPDQILHKPGSLTDEERAIMRRHPKYAYDMLSPIAYLRPALDIPYCHHEKWDGTGYPRGLKGEEIPMSARIFAITDVWDALHSDRPYRKGWPTEKVRDHIFSLSGTHFDPAVVAAFSELLQSGDYAAS